MHANAPLLLAVALLGACSERPPPPPVLDSGRSEMDSGTPVMVDGGPISRRPDGGSRLPPTDRTVVLPYLGDPEIEDLEIEGTIGALDVFFSVDTTGSFSGEINNLQSTVRSRIVPALRDRVADVRLGVGRFEDFPGDPYGAPDDRPFRLLTEITASDADVSRAVASLDQPLGNGGDVEEASAEALYQIATGAGYPGLVPAYRGAGIGGVGFREDALRAVVHVTDAPAHEPSDYGDRFPDTHGVTEATEALRGISARVIGIASGTAARVHLEEVALGTGATVEPDGSSCPTGVGGAPRPLRDGVCPLVFDVNPDGTGLGDVIIDALVDLLASLQYDEVWAETDDSLGFVTTLEAVDAEAPDGVAPPSRADLRPVDGIDETFVGVGPGTRLSFRAVLRNETIRPADYDQIFNLQLRIIGDGVTLLNRRIRVVVPRGRLDAGPGAVDAGADDGGTDAGADSGTDSG